MLLIIVIAALAAIFYGYHRRTKRRAQLREMLRLNADISPRLRISVIVDGAHSVGYIASLMRSDSTSYQLIIVDDFSHQEPLLRAAAHYFGLFRATYDPPAGPLKDAFRGLYRSHRRLYSKLVIVDSAASNKYRPHQVGATISSYDYSLLLKAPSTLKATAIEDLLLEIAMRQDEEVEEIRTIIGQRVRLLRREAVIAPCATKEHGKRGRVIKIDYKILN